MPKLASTLPPAGPGTWRLADSQNFITDPALVERLLRRVKACGTDMVIEIGPGRGAITAALSRLAPRVLAVEADPALALELVRRFANRRELTIACGNFLDFPLPAQPFIVVANIPFNRTADIVRKLTGENSGLKAAYLIMQAEAARKFCGRPPCSSLFAHLLRVEFEVEQLAGIPRACFTPRPRVDAAFTLFRKRDAPLLDGQAARGFKDLLCYLYPRGPFLETALKQLLTSRQRARLLGELKLDARAALRDLSFEQWLALHQAFAKHSTPADQALVKDAQARLAGEQSALQKRHRTRRL
jgi:23S rRNA (adenine-N6)-dimethyltransferase